MGEIRLEAIDVLVERAKRGDVAALGALVAGSASNDDEIRRVVKLSFPHVLDSLQHLDRPSLLDVLARNDWCTRQAVAQVLGLAICGRKEDVSFAAASTQLKATVGSDWRRRLALESASKLLTKHFSNQLSCQDAACTFAGLIRDNDSRVVQSALSVLVRMFDVTAKGGVGL